MIRKVNVLGFNQYMKEAHPEEYDRNLKEYANYSNWLDNKFLKLGHVYKTSNYDKFTKVFVLDGFKPIINDSYKLTYTYIVHFSYYKGHERDFDAPGWVNLDQAYKMMLDDITGTEDAFGKTIVPVKIDKQPYCEYDLRVVSKTEDRMEVVYTKFHHNSYEDYNKDGKKYNRHFCDMVYKRYTYELEDGEWVKAYESSLNKIRVAADNTNGWCHDTDCQGRDRYDGCFKNLRELKKKFLGVYSLATCPILFDDVKTLSTEMFVPYPIKSSNW